MRKVIGIGETVLDIIFQGDHPVAAKPGGSTFNALISLGRAGVSSLFMSETGNDKVGDIVVRFLKENKVDTSFVNRYDNGKSSISLAFLNEKNDADYTFYKDYTQQRIEANLPEINQDDIVLFGSFFALNPMLRSIVKALLDKANKHGAIIYYDPNFRSSHLHEREELTAAIIQNFNDATIVRGSDEDFRNILQTTNAQDTWQIMRQHCKTLIYTKNSDGVELFRKSGAKHYTVPKINPLSTIGAGDNFNAGIAYALIKYNILKSDLQSLQPSLWDKVIATAIHFSQDVCMSYDNYISPQLIIK